MRGLCSNPKHLRGVTVGCWQKAQILEVHKRDVLNLMRVVVREPNLPSSNYLKLFCEGSWQRSTIGVWGQWVSGYHLQSKSPWPPGRSCGWSAFSEHETVQWGVWVLRLSSSWRKASRKRQCTSLSTFSWRTSQEKSSRHPTLCTGGRRDREIRLLRRGHFTLSPSPLDTRQHLTGLRAPCFGRRVHEKVNFVS